MQKILAAVLSVVVLATLVAAAIVTVNPQRATATPISTDGTTYEINGRIFPDPHGGSAAVPGHSPYAKGNVPAVDFIQYEEMANGLKFLEDTFPKFSKYYTLNKDFKCNGKPASGDERCKKFWSAGLPVTTDDNGDTFVRERRRLHMFRVTDETSNIPIKKREWFVYPLSIHGIERAGVEGGVRAVEDLATWGACETLPANQIPDYVDCEGEVTGTAEKPYPLLESSPGDSLGTGEALKDAVVVVVFPNPDGWLRGDRFRDRVPSAQAYQRYNGNGVDVNRDWPTGGWTFRPYTPASEPETKSFGKVLREMGPKDPNGDAKWAGGIDLHGQLIDRAFSFTLLGAGEHDYAKNQAMIQVVKGAWRDAENRLGYSPIIKPNDAPETDPTCPGCVYGVQWGTVWDTIDYTITGGFGDWINNPIGLNAVGIDNEMSLSHLSNCAAGTCFVPDVEQLHVDGNKSLIYAMVNYTLKRENKTFGTKGRVGYVRNPGFIKAKTDRFKAPPKFTRLPTQDNSRNHMLNESNDYTFEFPVKGPRSSPKVYNGGIEVKLTGTVSPVDPNAEIADAMLERRVSKGDERPAECDPDPEVDCWEVINSYFLQGSGYNASGKALHANFPEPGRWRVRVEGNSTGFDADIFFTKEKGWNDPGQLGYKVSTMRFWKHLERFANPGIEPVSIGDIKNRNGWRQRYDTIVVTNRVYKNLSGKLKSWVDKQDGNLVLTDKAVGMLKSMGIVNGGVSSLNTYAGYINFETEDEENEDKGTYDDPSGLAKDVNQPGSAEGGQEENDEIEGAENHRHQIYEPVPLGIAIEDAGGSDQFNSPVWFVQKSALTAGQGASNPVGTTGSFENVSLGEVKYKGGTIRWTGALLPDPSEKFDHPFGLSNYAITYSGYQVIKNLLTYEK